MGIAVRKKKNNLLELLEIKGEDDHELSLIYLQTFKRNQVLDTDLIKIIL